jgi:hypothetical protein
LTVLLILFGMRLRAQAPITGAAVAAYVAAAKAGADLWRDRYGAMISGKIRAAAVASAASSTSAIRPQFHLSDRRGRSVSVDV